MMIVWRIGRYQDSELFRAVLCTTVVHSDTQRTHMSSYCVDWDVKLGQFVGENCKLHIYGYTSV